jgi:glycosyltransferase involved in cell wall biosynthesis
VIRVAAVSDAAEVMGTEHSLLNLAERLPSSGVEMMLAARSGGSLERRWRELGLPFHALTLPRRRGFRPHSGQGYHGLAELSRLPYRTLVSIRRIVEMSRAARPDVLHSNSLITHFDCAIAGRITGTRSVLELHDIVAPGVGRIMTGLAVRLSGTAIAVSSAVKNQVPRWARDRVVVIAQGIDAERFDTDDTGGEWRGKLTSAPRATLVAAIGRMDPEKGLHILIQAVALARAAGADLHLALVGTPGKDNGDYRDHLKALGETMIPDAFRMLPRVCDVPAVLRSIDILACPSFEEPFGLILLEAQACRVPVVASASGGPPEFITHEETGMLVEPGDTYGYALTLQRLATDQQLRHRIAAAGQARVRSRYTADIRAHRVASVYRRNTAAVVPC